MAERYLSRDAVDRALQAGRDVEQWLGARTDPRGTATAIPGGCLSEADISTAESLAGHAGAPCTTPSVAVVTGLARHAQGRLNSSAVASFAGIPSGTTMTPPVRRTLPFGRRVGLTVVSRPRTGSSVKSKVPACGS